MKRKWEIEDEQMRKKCAEEVLTRIKEQQEVEFGVIAAEDIIDIVASNIGPSIYNMAINDVKKLMQNKLEDLEVEITLLEQNE